MGNTVTTDLAVSFEPLETHGNVPSSRSGFSFVGAKGKFYLHGGVIEDPNLYCLSGNEWSIVANASMEPKSGSCAAVIGGKIFLFGGLHAERGWTSDMVCFDVDAGTWSVIEGKGEVPCARDKGAMVAVGGNLVLFGGFGPTDIVPVAMSEGEDIAVADDDNMDDGDDDEEEEEEEDRGESVNFTWFNDLFVFNVAKQEWRRVAQQQSPQPAPRAAHTLSLADGRLWLFGGRTSLGRVNELWSVSVAEVLSSPDAIVWRQHSDGSGIVPSNRSFHCAWHCGNRIVVGGGVDSADVAICDVHMWDAQQQVWAQPRGGRGARGQKAAQTEGRMMVAEDGQENEEVVRVSVALESEVEKANVQIQKPPPQ